MAYPSDFVLIIPDKTTTNVISWHQMDTLQVVLDTRLVLEVLRYLLFTVTLHSLQFCASWSTSSSRSTMATSIILSDVTSLCTVAAYTQTSTKMHLFISHFLSAGLTFYNCLTVSHPHLMVFVAVACCLGHAKNSDWLTDWYLWRRPTSP